MKISWDYYRFPRYGLVKNVPNHQPGSLLWRLFNLFHHSCWNHRRTSHHPWSFGRLSWADEVAQVAASMKRPMCSRSFCLLLSCFSLLLSCLNSPKVCRPQRSPTTCSTYLHLQDVETMRASRCSESRRFFAAFSPTPRLMNCAWRFSACQAKRMAWWMLPTVLMRTNLSCNLSTVT